MKTGTIFNIHMLPGNIFDSSKFHKNQLTFCIDFLDLNIFSDFEKYHGPII